ncbi:hypothetical protein AB0J01_28175 [Streptomyces sp. NPDC050204]|uniref:hypothetical protein n=1 Tax=Streptomyces sp. NPDC050204 TaxID=3155514 RepID=UPI0034217B4F
MQRLRHLADESTGDELAALPLYDVLSIATTAVELTDRYGIDDEEMRAAVEDARAYVEVDDMWLCPRLDSRQRLFTATEGAHSAA